MQRDLRRSDDRSYRWFVVQVFVGAEAFAARMLRQRGIAVVRPTHVVRGERRALFPGYLLVGHWRGAEMRWDLVASSPKVLSVVGIQGEPEELNPVDVWKVIRAAAKARFDVPDAAAIAAIQVGDHVRVRGSMIDQVMEVRAVRAGVAELFAKFFGGERVVEAPIGKLIAAQ